MPSDLIRHAAAVGKLHIDVEKLADALLRKEPMIHLPLEECPPVPAIYPVIDVRRNKAPD